MAAMGYCTSELDLLHSQTPEAAAIQGYQYPLEGEFGSDFILDQRNLDSYFQDIQFDPLPLDIASCTSPKNVDYYSHPHLSSFDRSPNAFLEDDCKSVILIPCPKRRKLCECLPNLPEIPSLPVPEFQLRQTTEYPPTALQVNRCSAQSVAARERRRRIAEKTQRLGKLIPGGGNFNTAEMLLVAFKYVKFLQAQVAILELITSNNQDMEVAHAENCREELEELLFSPAVHEKLYLQEKCLIPASVLTSLMQRDEIASNSTLCFDLNHLLTHSRVAY